MKLHYKLLLLTLVATPMLLANELSWVDEQIEAIKPARVGITSAEISKLSDPFIFLQPKEIKESKTTTRIRTTSVKKHYVKHYRRSRYRGLSLEAILNKAALINGKWYKLNDKVYGYTISSIHAKTVTLKRYHKIKILSTESKKSNLKLIK